MTRLFLYILGASRNPNSIECSVPFLVNKREIFFGPCKKRLREQLYRKYLKTSQSGYLRVKDDLFVVGVNASNNEQLRKIVWVGRIQRLMTFEAAFRKLTAPRYQEMRREQYSPLHVKPLYNRKSIFIGYEHRSKLHSRNDGWMLDFTNSRRSLLVKHSGKKLLLAPRAGRHQAFPRDCCFLLNNVFFAQGRGLSITGGMVKLLKHVQPKERKPDDYAIFGYREDESVDGLTGRWLEIVGADAGKFLTLIRSNLPVSATYPKAKRQLKSCNC